MLRGIPYVALITMAGLTMGWIGKAPAQPGREGKKGDKKARKRRAMRSRDSGIASKGFASNTRSLAQRNRNAKPCYGHSPGSSQGTVHLRPANELTYEALMHGHLALSRRLIASLLAVAASPAWSDPSQWLDVPYVRQVEAGCGAASIAMVMQLLGSARTPH